MPPPQAVVAPDQEQQEAAKKKKPTVLSNMFSIFTKGKKKRGQPSLVEPPLVPESKPGLDGPIPTGRLGLWLGLGACLALVQAWAWMGHGSEGALTQDRAGREVSIFLLHLCPWSWGPEWGGILSGHWPYPWGLSRPLPQSA